MFPRELWVKWKLPQQQPCSLQKVVLFHVAVMMHARAIKTRNEKLAAKPRILNECKRDVQPALTVFL